MKDYKHVKVPRGYRTTNRRTATRRVNTAISPSKRGGGGGNPAGAAIAVLLTAALCFGAWEGYRWLTRAEMFQIAGVDVKGVRSVSEDDIRELAKMFTGQNIFHVDLDAATRRALANPWVREVRIERTLPNRISVIYAEREPRAILQAANGRYLIDGEGVVMVPAAKSELAADLPVIAVRDHKAVPREAVAGSAVAEALTLLDELARRGGWSAGEVSVKADSPETIAIVYADHEFRIGSGNYDEKLRRLGEIVADMQQRGLAFTYVELRPERQAAVMIAKSEKERRYEGKKGSRTGR